MMLSYYIPVVLVLFLNSAGADTNIIPNENVYLNFTCEDVCTAFMNENNHVEGANYTLLFTVNTTESVQPTIKFSTENTFTFNLLKLDNQNKYEFYATQVFDYETQPNQYLIIIYVDTNPYAVVLNIINIDDEPPTLTSPMCSMKENTEFNYTNVNCTCVLSDPDGWLSQTTFSVKDSNPNATEVLERESELFHFDINRTVPDDVYETTVYITTLNTLDYETKIFYSFNVEAKDGANHSTIPKPDVKCIINVEDVNDMPPQFTDYFTTQQIYEEEEYNNFSIKAVDGDKGINAKIWYYIEPIDADSDTDPYISIGQKDGKLLIQKIDRDAKDLLTYKFRVRAEEQDDPKFNKTVDVTLFIEDIDDNSPLVMSVTNDRGDNIIIDYDDTKYVEFWILENFADTLNGTINITDIDTGENAQFTTELLDAGNVTATDAFMIVPIAGYRTGDFQVTVKNKTYLDYENPPWDNFQFQVHSYGKNHSKQDMLTIKIHLIDYNDEVPIFSESSYTQSVNETIKKDEFIIQVKATDRDAEDKILTHELVGATTITDLMSIDSAEGIITVAVDNAFDYDRINPIIFQVQAIDHAKPPHVTTVPVTISLIDINNKAPTYKVDDIIQVEENQIIGIYLNATITASDVDTTRNLSAQINWDESYAMKNSQRVTSTDLSNKDAIQFLDLEYNIKDGSKDGTIEIKLKINDNNPNETTPDYETFDTLYLNVTITDWNTELPDFKDKMNTSALIVIYIIDINDNWPIFTNATLSKNRTIEEVASSGAIVGTIEAIDKDIGNEVKYSCKYQAKEYDWFETDINGQITVKKNSHIDCDIYKEWNVSINCFASDGVHITPQIFNIYIIDKNNKIPQIFINGTESSSSVVEVYEKSPINTFVTNVNYTDEDRDIPYHTAICNFQDLNEECYSSFYVTSDNVVLVKIGGNDLNRDEGLRKYTCTLTCRDNPKGGEYDITQNQNITTFTIKLLDINDHCPKLAIGSFDYSTSENTKTGSFIGSVIATDIDEGNNAEIDMKILTVYYNNNIDVTDKNFFNLVKDESDYYVNETHKRWHLVVLNDLKDSYGDYKLQLELWDHGNPPNSTELPINKEIKKKSILSVTVTKFNYYSPTFVYPTEKDTSILLSSDQEPGKQLVQFRKSIMLPNIKITDGEKNSCIDKWVPKFNIEVTSPTGFTNLFKAEIIDRCTAQLQVTNPYNKTAVVAVKNFKAQLTTSLKDGPPSANEKPYSESIELTISFADVDQDPVFDPTLGSWNITFLEEDATLAYPMDDKRKAQYPNVVDPDVTVFYFIKSTSQIVMDTFDIDRTSGTIKLKQKLDYEEIKSYEFQIQASKNQSGISGNSQSVLDVFVKVIDINDHTPQWTEDTFFGAIMYSYQTNRVILTANATDKDEIDQGKLKYSLNSTVEPHGTDISAMTEPFIVTESTGDIVLNFNVEKTMSGYFIFWISVQDEKDAYNNGPHYNRTSVSIYFVTDENTVPFAFDNNMEDVVKVRLQVLSSISKALDWKCYDQDIYKDPQNENNTKVNVYCIDNKVLLKSNDILKKLNNINTFQNLKQDLLNNRLALLPISPTTNTSPENLEQMLKATLIGVSVGLGALSLVLGVLFFLKTRELNRRIKKLTEPQFGSDESNLNRKGINVPTANVFAVEGSNPVFSNEIDRDIHTKYDKESIHSGDSDLIGLEDSPEFDMFDNHNSEKR